MAELLASFSHGRQFTLWKPLNVLKSMMFSFLGCFTVFFIPCQSFFRGGGIPTLGKGPWRIHWDKNTWVLNAGSGNSASRASFSVSWNNTWEYFNTVSVRKTQLIFRISLQQRKASLWTLEEKNSFWSSWYAVRLRTTPFQNWPIWGCRLVGLSLPKHKNRHDSLNHYSQPLGDRNRRMRSLRSLLIHSEFIWNTKYMWTCPLKWSMLHHRELMLKNALWSLAKTNVFRVHLPIRLREQIIYGSWYSKRLMKILSL